ncbi:MAG: fatty acid desaturase [Gammaproteobacteria bacterium]
MFQPLSHLLCFVFPVGTCLFLSSGPHEIQNILIWTLPFWIVLLADWRGPSVTRQLAPRYSGRYYDGILIVLSLLQLVNIVLMLIYVSRLQWYSLHDAASGLINLIVVRFIVGTSSGTSGIVVAHELIHRQQWPMQQLGRLLLCTVCYEHFVISHKQGHHERLGLPDDIATARLGESFDGYWKRIFSGYFRYAWHSELIRLGIETRPIQRKLLYNRVLQGVALELFFLAAILAVYGGLAAFMFLYQSFAAVRILEAVNYFQHWGLEDGRFGKSFGWVTDSWISRHALIGLSNHIGHHEDENRHYYEIAYSDRGPKLPYGYFVMNLWVKLNNASFQAMAMRELRQFRQSQPT